MAWPHVFSLALLPLSQSLLILLWKTTTIDTRPKKIYIRPTNQPTFCIWMKYELQKDLNKNDFVCVLQKISLKINLCCLKAHRKNKQQQQQQKQTPDITIVFVTHSFIFLIYYNKTYKRKGKTLMKMEKINKNEIKWQKGIKREMICVVHIETYVCNTYKHEGSEMS